MINTGAVGGIYEAGRYDSNITATRSKTINRNASFEALFHSAKEMVRETNDLTNAAEEQEINYALGISTSLHDLMVAQQKANISLQYTVAVRNTVMDAYKEIMNLQF